MPRDADRGGGYSACVEGGREYNGARGMRKNLCWQAAALAGVALFLATGCESLPHCPETNAGRKTSKVDLEAEEPFHVIELDGNGMMYDLRPTSGHAKLPGPAAVTNYLTTNIWEHFKSSGKTNILVFVHGGMNSRDVGLKHYLEGYKKIDEKDYYPVFVVWPSGPWTTYVEHLLWVRQGIKAETKTDKTFSLLTVPFMLVADLGRAMARLPMVIANNTRTDTETIIPIRNQNGGTMYKDYQRIAEEGYHVHIEDDYSRWSDRLVRDVSYNLTLPVKYVTSSLIDGLGMGAWDDMLRRTQTAYPGRWLEEDVANPVVKTGSKPGLNAGPPDSGKVARGEKRKRKRTQHYAAAGLPAFFEMLRNFQTTNGTASEITVVGHSMGTIILNRVMRDTKIDFANIVYMGAACSIEDYSASVLPYLWEHTNTQFYSLSLHPVAEAGELCWMAADLLPRGSLLIWLDNFLMNPVTEQERTLGRWRNLFRTSATGEPVIRRFFDNHDSEFLKERLHFRAFSVGDGDVDQMRSDKYQWNDHQTKKGVMQRCNTPLVHGDFPEMPYWLSEFWWKE